MPLHYLDPKQTDGPKDVEVWQSGLSDRWYCFPVGWTALSSPLGSGDTETEALRDARFRQQATLTEGTTALSVVSARIP